MLCLYSLDILFRRSVTLPDAVKWNQNKGGKKQVCYEERISLLLERQARLTANECSVCV